MRSGFLPIVLAALAVPITARAQQQCDLSSQPNTKYVQLNAGTPSEQAFIGGGVVFVCPDGKVIKSDSAMVVKSRQMTFLIGHAYYSDKEKTLTGDRIYYWGAEQHLTSQSGPTQPTGVVFTDKVNGAVITGQFLDYYQARPGQPESKATMYGGKPHAVLRGKQSGAAPAGTPDTSATLVDAERFEIQGQKTFHALGNVVLTRSDMKGTAAEAFYDPDADHLKLVGDAKVTGQDVSLAGGTIEGNLAGHQFKDVTAVFRAVLESKDLKVNAPSLTVSFDSGQVQRMVALSAQRAKRTATDGNVLAEAVAKDFKLVADSIDAKAPNQKIEQVVAVGRAYGERQNDSIKVKMPDIASKDWLRGDTITGYFADATPKAAPEKGRNGNAVRSVAPKNGRAPASRGGPAPAAAPDSVERVLERIVAVGKEPPASSMYRLLNDKKPDAPPTLDYVLAKRIVVAFRDGQVHTVNLDGEIRGIHLEPEQPKKGKAAAPPRKNVAQAPADTTAGRPRQ